MNGRYLTVSALTKYIKRKLSHDPHLKEVWLRGEISNFKLHSRGHMYLSIKDEKSRIQAVMFAGNNRKLKFAPENGMNVLIRGEINVYEPMGNYQLYIQDMQPDGIGALYLAFEQLKEKLQREGLFDDSSKKELPSYPEHIGVITSQTGAAVRDILTTIKRRYPIVKVSIIPVLVQGNSAAASVDKAIRYANEQLDCDVLIVGRGGGSIEDLWSFNEELVARAIHSSLIPIISAVGHETDTTISDFVADVRAATPTGAAEVAVPSLKELSEQLKLTTQRLTRAVTVKRAEANERLTRLRKSYAFKYPEQLMKQKEQDLDRVLEQLSKSIHDLQKQKNDWLTHINKRLNQQHTASDVQVSRKQLSKLTKQLTGNFNMQFRIKKDQFHTVLDKLTLVNPLDIMKRGYAIPYTQGGNVLKSVNQTKTGGLLTVKVQDGQLYCTVNEIEEDES
ncbi:exodeoxyribonuclease VII large subunit [Halobacillus shinanisalinarum]|uniref:Exodeoxyribonuclease 7 large subunit n=1 Tax=Halobacillus shinanisalinarum TaxID=2932258 RepID=A0ABY4H0I5_9BACI|nr:exodeoxyribonuclease VII large subunit [Halobacillus shinanisalinarum]UOQ93696.1 exodeoxyribonuclease VII large subunit [Halobacillus shinanisalinarum]